jgi:hypothetical protein
MRCYQALHTASNGERYNAQLLGLLPRHPALRLPLVHSTPCLQLATLFLFLCIRDLLVLVGGNAQTHKHKLVYAWCVRSHVEKMLCAAHTNDLCM